MSGMDLNVDYDKHAQDAEDTINNISNMLKNGQLQNGAHNEDLPIDDNISVNSKDLAALEDDMSDGEIERMLNGDMNDDELKGLMDDDSDCGDFDMDDPLALEKLEAKQNAKSKPPAPKPEPKKPEPKQQQQPAAASTKPETKLPPAKSAPPTTTTPKPSEKSTPVTTTTAPPPATTTTTPEAAKTPAKLTKQQIEEYNRLIQSITDNIADLKAEITLYLRAKNQDLASKYLPIMKQSEGFLKHVNELKEKNEPLPSYSYVGVSITKERKIPEIKEDDVHLTVLNIVGIKSTAKYSFKTTLTIGKEQSKTTKQVKGKDVVEFNETLIFTLAPANIRSSQNGIKLCKLGRGSIELHSHGLLWGSTVLGSGDFKISPLQSKCESVQTIKIKNEDDEVLGEVEIKLAVNRPFVTPEPLTTTLNLVKIDIVQPPPPQLPPVTAPTTTKTTPGATTKSAPATTTTPGTTPTPPASAPATTTPTPQQPKEIDPDDMTPIQIVKASGFKRDVKVFQTLGELPPFVSMDTLAWEIAQCTEMCKTKQFKRRLDAYNAQSRISDCNLRTTVLQAQVGDGKLTLDEYMTLMRGQVEYETSLEEEVMKVAKWYKSKEKSDDAKYYFELVLWIRKRKEITAAEIKTVEENMDDMVDGDEEEAE